LNPNPLQQTIAVSWVEDPIIKNTGVPVEFVKKYPDSVCEIALNYVKNPPDLLFLRTNSNTSPKLISERSLYWMQIYGPAGSRLTHMEKCISVSTQLVQRFKHSPYFGQVSPFDRNYRALIPYILQNTPFEPLALPLVHAFSAYFHSRAFDLKNNSEMSENSSKSDLSDNTVDIHSTEKRGKNDNSDQMSDITEPAFEEDQDDRPDIFPHEEVPHSDAEPIHVQPNTEEPPQHLQPNTDELPQHDNDEQLDTEETTKETDGVIPMDLSLTINNDNSHPPKNREIQESNWKTIVNNKFMICTTNQTNNHPPPAKKSDLPNYTTNQNSGFLPVPNCKSIEYFNPPCHQELQKNKKLKMFISILEDMPLLIKKYLPMERLTELHKKHCLDKPNENDRSLVLIDGQRFEFYIPTENDDNDRQELYPLMFDEIILKPLLSTWSNGKYASKHIKAPHDFKIMLKKYISRCFENSFNIHAVSLILDYPGTSEVRQWSHIDGYKNMFQGSVSCGNGSTVTLEFPILNPKITTVADLKEVWTFLPEKNNVFDAIISNNFCTDLLNQYGTLLNHNANSPLNPIPYQRALARLSPYYKAGHNSPFLAGTIFKMPGNTIHAGPKSDAHLCRTIFFFAASPPCAPQYDPTTQWNQVTLTAAILEAIWDEIIPLERGYILDYIRRVQSNSKIAPSDTSLFIGNYTLRLFVRVVLFVKQISKSYPNRQTKYIEFLQKIASIDHIKQQKQFITTQMIQEMDPQLMDIIFQHEGEELSKQFFHL
jgi:hypothetical protein